MHGWIFVYLWCLHQSSGILWSAVLHAQAGLMVYIDDSHWIKVWEWEAATCMPTSLFYVYAVFLNCPCLLSRTPGTIVVVPSPTSFRLASSTATAPHACPWW